MKRQPTEKVQIFANNLSDKRLISKINKELIKLILKKKKVRGPEQTFFQRRHTKDQQIHDKVLRDTNHKENANQKHNEIPPHNYESGYDQQPFQF